MEEILYFVQIRLSFKCSCLISTLSPVGLLNVSVSVFGIGSFAEWNLLRN